MQSDSFNLVDLSGLSQQLNLSKRWLSSEATSRRIPSLKAGGKRVFNVEAVRRALEDRAADQSDGLDTSHTSSEVESCDRYSDGSNESRWETAIHEAGHAVSAHALGILVRHVHVWPDGGGLCGIETTIMHNSLATMLAAGPIAQIRWSKEFVRPSQTTPMETLERQRVELEQRLKSNPPRIDDASMTDEARLRDWVTTRCARNPYLWASRLVKIDREANEILDMHKSGVLNLARALYMYGELIGKDAENAMFWPGGVKPDTHPELASPTDPASEKIIEEPPEPIVESSEPIEPPSPKPTVKPTDLLDLGSVSGYTPNQLADAWVKQTPSTQDPSSADGWNGSMSND